MIFSAFGAYDADAPEGDKGYSSQYINKKDIVRIGIVIVGVVALGIPVFLIMKDGAERTTCKKNIRGAWAALSQYAEGYDQRFPPMFDEGDGGAPYLEKGMPIVWASRVAGMLPSEVDLTCPTAHAEENTKVNGRLVSRTRGPEEVVSDHINLSYGMYGPLSSRPVSDILDEAGTVLIGETANHGARGTYNPVPFVNSAGEEVPFDGFQIGWDTQNRGFLESGSVLDAEAVTRMAFYNTSDGDFAKAGVRARHDSFVFVVYVNGTLGQIGPGDARLAKAGSRVTRLFSPD